MHDAEHSSVGAERECKNDACAVCTHAADGVVMARGPSTRSNSYETCLAGRLNT